MADFHRGCVERSYCTLGAVFEFSYHKNFSPDSKKIGKDRHRLVLFRMPKNLAASLSAPKVGETRSDDYRVDIPLLGADVGRWRGAGALQNVECISVAKKDGKFCPYGLKESIDNGGAAASPLLRPLPCFSVINIERRVKKRPLRKTENSRVSPFKELAPPLLSPYNNSRSFSDKVKSVCGGIGLEEVKQKMLDIDDDDEGDGKVTAHQGETRGKETDEESDGEVGDMIVDTIMDTSDKSPSKVNTLAVNPVVDTTGHLDSSEDFKSAISSLQLSPSDSLFHDTQDAVPVIGNTQHQEQKAEDGEQKKEKKKKKRKLEAEVESKESSIVASGTPPIHVETLVEVTVKKKKKKKRVEEKENETEKICNDVSMVAGAYFTSIPNRK